MSGITITADSATQFEAGAAEYNSTARLDDTHFAVAYRDGNDFNKGKVVVGTRSGTTVTISEANLQVFNNDTTDTIQVKALSASKIAITFQDTNSGKPYVVICTVSGVTITVGTPVLIIAAESTSTPTVAVLDSSNIVVTVKKTIASVYTIVSFVGSVSGTNISFGSQQTIVGSSKQYCNSIGLDSTHYAIAYMDISIGATYTVVCSVDTGAQTVTVGTLDQFVFYSDTVIPLIDKFDSQHIIIANTYSAFSGYTDLHISAVSFNLTSLVGTIGNNLALTTSLSTDSNYGICCINTHSFIVSYYTTVGTQGEVRSGTLSGTATLAFDAAGMAFDNGASAYTALCALTSSYFLLGYKRG